MKNVDENEEKWKREGGKIGKNEKGKEENQKFKGKKDSKKLDFFFFFFFFFLIFTLRKRLKLLRGNLYREKPKITPGKNGEKRLCPPPENFSCYAPASYTNKQVSPTHHICLSQCHPLGYHLNPINDMLVLFCSLPFSELHSKKLPGSHSYFCLQQQLALSALSAFSTMGRNGTPPP